MNGPARLVRIPEKVHSIDDLCGVIRHMDGVESIAVLTQDQNGVMVMTLDGTTSERVNWMLDRAKLLLHNVFG